MTILRQLGASQRIPREDRKTRGFSALRDNVHGMSSLPLLYFPALLISGFQVQVLGGSSLIPKHLIVTRFSIKNHDRSEKRRDCFLSFAGLPSRDRGPTRHEIGDCLARR